MTRMLILIRPWHVMPVIGARERRIILGVARRPVTFVSLKNLSAQAIFKQRVRNVSSGGRMNYPKPELAPTCCVTFACSAPVWRKRTIITVICVSDLCFGLWHPFYQWLRRRGALIIVMVVFCCGGVLYVIMMLSRSFGSVVGCDDSSA